MLTNRYNLPAPLVNAVRNDTYSRGRSDISVTQLIQPPQIRYLSKGMELEEDVSDFIWRLLGQAVHTILERACDGKDIAEQRVYSNVRGWVVSGQFDLHEEDFTLNDYKITSVYARDGKMEWVNQLNLLRALCVRNGKRVDKLQIVAIFRDWRKKEALSADYPQSQVAVIPVEMWPLEKAEAYLDERVRLHQLEIPPPCTDEERWKRPTKWALMKKNRKRAVKLFDSKPVFVTLDKDQFWEIRPGGYARCEAYCSVSRLCPQWKAYEESQRSDEDGITKQEDVADAAGCVEADQMES
jgi:hypothetical protein